MLRTARELVRCALRGHLGRVVGARSWPVGCELTARGKELRDKQPWQFENTEVSKVILTLKGDEPVEFSRNDLRRWSGPNGQLTTPSETTMNKTLDALGKFRVERWLVQGDDKFSVPTFGFLDTAERIELEVKQSGRLVRHKLHLGAANLQGDRYAATTGPDGQMVVFTFPEVVYAQVLKTYALLPD